jgi:NAD(P)-dependent dehydrogenase (short-subunit alcohol dehydrogenase family)
MGLLAGQVALVTGAGQGVGRGIAIALAQEGAMVAVTGRTESKLHAVTAEIEESGGRALAIRCDVRDADDIRHTVDRTVAELGGIAILVNNAQEAPLGPLLTVKEEALQNAWSSGPLATFRFMRACHPHIQARGGGTIINLATAAARRWDMRNYGAYAAVKEAIRSLTRAAADEWGPDNIRVLAIAPLALSPGVERWAKHNPDEAQTLFSAIPLGRVGALVEDIGRAVVMLVGPDARYITGATIPIDGGHARWD